MLIKEGILIRGLMVCCEKLDATFISCFSITDNTEMLVLG